MVLDGRERERERGCLCGVVVSESSRLSFVVQYYSGGGLEI